MGMTLGVYTNDSDHKYLGTIPLKFYGYTRIEKLQSCKLLAAMVDESPEDIDTAMCASYPRYILNKSEALTFLYHYVSDAMYYINTGDTADDQKCRACVSAYTEYIVMVLRLKDIECDSFEFSWC